MSVSYWVRFFLELPKILKVRNYTMVTPGGLFQMHELIRQAPPGAIVETGCWKGGCGAYMAVSGRPTFLFDSFVGFDKFTAEDLDIVDKRGEDLSYIATPEEDAHNIARALKVNVTIVKGFFKDTLSRTETGPIAILRLDSDTYHSTREVLNTLFERVVPGGFIIIDDYESFSGCRKAVYEFFVAYNFAPKLRHFYRGRVYFKKASDIDLSSSIVIMDTKGSGL